MRLRPLFRIPIFLLAGAATTWLVAWGLAFRTINDDGVWFKAVVGLDGSLSDSTFPLAGPRQLSVKRYEGRGAMIIDSFADGDNTPIISGTPIRFPRRSATELDQVVPVWALPESLPWLTDIRTWPAESIVSRVVDARGWPFLALYTVEGWSRAETREHRGGIVVTEPRARVTGEVMRFFSVRQDSPVILPCLPIWRGFLADTAIFGAAWWAVFLIPAGVRRVLCRKKGVCPRCGYDLRGLPAGAPCPECGPASARQVARASGP